LEGLQMMHIRDQTHRAMANFLVVSLDSVYDRTTH
jgi:hypothetical protein